jgi:hypothetical protein
MEALVHFFQNRGMTTTVSTNWAPQWTLLAVTASTRPSISSIVEDKDRAREDALTDPFDTKSQTRVVESYRAQSSSCVARWPPPSEWPDQRGRLLAQG